MLREKHEEDVEELMRWIDMIRTQSAMVTIQVLDTNNNPIPGVAASNVTDRDGNVLYTNDQGEMTAVISAQNNFKPTFYNYLDIASFNIPSTNLVSGNVQTINIKATRRNFVNISTGATYYASGLVKKINASLVGGGGGGGYMGSNDGPGGGGGGGGVTLTGDFIPDYKTAYPISVGSGGNQSSSGGTTSAFSISAGGGKAGSNSPSPGVPGNGGTGGSGGGNGGKGASGATATAGSNGTVKYYTGFDTESTAGPGGGGGGGSGWIDYSTDPYNGTAHIYAGGAGGNVGGGKGGTPNRDTASLGGFSGGAGSNGTNGGGGGGSYQSGGTSKGGAGFVAVRMYFS